MRISALCQLAFFGISVQALAFPGPQPTGVITLEDANGWTPKPTAAPAFHQVLRRQNGRPSNYIAAPDNTCGYVDGNKRDPLTCPDEQQCIFITASGKSPAGVGCCGNGGCNFHTACLDRKDLRDCDEDCQADPQILKCSGFGQQLCNTISYGLGAVDYYCSIFRQRSIAEADTTHVGQKTRTMSTITPTSTSTRRTSTVRSSSSNSSQSSDSASSSETETSATDRSLETSSSSVDTAPAATSSDAAAAVPAESSSSNTGAIVGGVIGIIGAIALIVFAFIFVRRRKRQQEGQEQIPDGPPQPPMYQQPSSQPPSQPPSQPQMYQQSAPPAQPSSYANSQATTYQQSYQPSPPSMYEQQQQSSYQQQPPPQPVPVMSPFSDPPRQHQGHPETASFTSISSSSAASAIPPPLKLSSSASSPYQQQATPAQFSPLSGSTIAALAPIPNTQKSAYHNHPPPEKSPNYYPAPSPMSTPAASPRFSFDGMPQAPQPLQPYRPESAAYPNQPQYQPKQYKPFVPNVSATYMPSATNQEAMDSPMSAYNALPVSPVSALGSHPMDDLPVVLATATAGTRRSPSVRRGSGDKGGPVPLVLQPGLGAQRFAPGTVKQVTVQRGMSRRGQNPKPASPVQQQEGQPQSKQAQSPKEPTQSQEVQPPISEEGEKNQKDTPQPHNQNVGEPQKGEIQEKEPHQAEKVAAAP
ncbi:hypothetical protein QBC40DRAFT_211723 [Triangularia verruculosa]|uniref:Uncharacterized protein n=1 Tax=Triangularia verruculosa TaxID=2587418 RepID=A0AAN6XB20_9PEZI|nr:hypothetical protein QBC40DRAFT_211723 [Triangularia verruculosa]